MSGEWNLWTFPLPGFNIILVRWFRCWRHFAHAISFTASPRAALYFCNTGQPCHARAQIVKKIDNVFRNVLIWHNKSVNLQRWVARTMGQTNRRPRVWCSKYYFFSWFLAKFFAKILSIYFLIFFYKITKMKIVLSALSL